MIRSIVKSIQRTSKKKLKKQQKQEQDKGKHESESRHNKHSKTYQQPIHKPTTRTYTRGYIPPTGGTASCESDDQKQHRKDTQGNDKTGYNFSVACNAHYGEVPYLLLILVVDLALHQGYLTVVLQQALRDDRDATQRETHAARETTACYMRARAKQQLYAARRHQKHITLCSGERRSFPNHTPLFSIFWQGCTLTKSNGAVRGTPAMDADHCDKRQRFRYHNNRCPSCDQAHSKTNQKRAAKKVQNEQNT